MIEINALEGDTVDAICWRVLGSHSDDLLAEVFALNPGIVETETLTAGQLVRLPESVSVPDSESGITLWD